jgi:hypothetical protein
MRIILNGFLLIIALVVVAWFAQKAFHAAGMTKQEHTVSSVMNQARGGASDAYYDLKYNKYIKSWRQNVQEWIDRRREESQHSTDDLKKVTPDSIGDNFK